MDDDRVRTDKTVRLTGETFAQINGWSKTLRELHSFLSYSLRHDVTRDKLRR